MSQKKKQIDAIIDLLTTWSKRIEFNNMLGYYDVNKTSEGLVFQLMNLTFGYKLTNLNREKSNYPGIDLGDTENKIAIQVTSRKDADKIRDNLKKFVDKKYNETYTNGIRFLILTMDNTPISFSKNPPTNIYPQFNVEKDIITFKDIIKKIDDIYDLDYPQFDNIKSLLEKELIVDTMLVNKGAEEAPVLTFSFQHQDFVSLDEAEIAIVLQDISREYQQNQSIQFGISIEEEELIHSAITELKKDVSTKNRQLIADMKDIISYLDKVKEEIRFKVSSIVSLRFKEGYSNASFEPFAKSLFGLLSNLLEVEETLLSTKIDDILESKYRAKKIKGGNEMSLLVTNGDINFKIYETPEKINQVFKKYLKTFDINNQEMIRMSAIYGIEVSDLGYDTIISKVIPAFVARSYKNKYKLEHGRLNDFNVEIA